MFTRITVLGVTEFGILLMAFIARNTSETVVCAGFAVEIDLCSCEKSPKACCSLSWRFSGLYDSIVTLNLQSYKIIFQQVLS